MCPSNNRVPCAAEKQVGLGTLMPTKGGSLMARGGAFVAALRGSLAKGSLTQAQTDLISFHMLHKALQVSSPFCLKIFADKNKSRLLWMIWLPHGIFNHC